MAFACFECNRYKGSDVGSYDPETNQLTPLFNPRHQAWNTHFRFDEGIIIPLTPEGRVTVSLLRLNDLALLRERLALRIGFNE